MMHCIYNQVKSAPEFRHITLCRRYNKTLARLRLLFPVKVAVSVLTEDKPFCNFSGMLPFALPMTVPLQSFVVISQNNIVMFALELLQFENNICPICCFANPLIYPIH